MISTKRTTGGKVPARKGANAVLSTILALSLMITSVPQAFAEEAPDSAPAADQEAPAQAAPEGSDQPAVAPEPEAAPERISETVEIAKAPAPESPEKAAPEQNRATSEVPLAPEAPKAQVGAIVSDGLEYALNQDGTSVTLVGFYNEPASADIVVPSEIKTGGDAYAVTNVNLRGGARISLRLI